MVYSVIWSTTAKRTYYQIIEFLIEKWTEKEAEVFINRVEEVLGYIKENPFLYPYSEASDTFKCVVVKQGILFYQLGMEVELLLFWDTRRDPANLKFG